jgi:hypothetical protein
MDYYPSQGWDKYGRSWYMGLCLLGDGTLNLGDQKAVAVSEENDFSPQLMDVPEILRGRGTIELSVPQGIEVEVTVFNSVGQKHADLYRGYLSPGNHLIDWETSHYPPGVYFVSVNAGGSRLTRKTTVLR